MRILTMSQSKNGYKKPKKGGVGNAMYKTQKTLTPFKSPYHDTLSGVSIKRFQST